MCGIAGELRLEPGGKASPERVRAMCDAMVHRGPDSFGAFADGEVALGMRRLAINDVEGGLQPLGNEDGSIQLVCNGEIYNYPALREEVLSKGHGLRTGSDVEVIAHLYEEYGLDMVARLEGMFALALWDARRRRLVLGRDRVGIKPLYVAQQHGRLLFASELKCLLAAGLDAAIDPQSLHDYLTLGYVPGPESIVAGVRQLKPGHFLVAEPWHASERVQERRYWTLAGQVAQRETKPEAAWQEELLHTLRETVRNHLMADVPLGVFLSGGLDSGTIVSLMSELGVSPIRTFTIGFEEKSYSEIDLARQVAQRYGTEHHELVVRPDDATLLPTLARSFDEPYADDAAVPVYYLSALASRHVKVVLSGEGGDEALAGYQTYLAGRYARMYARLPRVVGAGLVPAIVRRLPVSHDRVSFDYKAKRFVTGAYLPPAAAHLWWKTVLTEDVKASLYAHGTPAGVEPTVRLYERFWNEADGDELDRVQYVDNHVYLPADILVKGDRMSMAHSLEARVPFCDRAVLELARRIPSSLRLKGSTTKYLLRRAMAGRLPEEIVSGKKKGFNVPISAWVAGSLREFTRDVLDPARLRRQGLLDPAAVTRLVSEHERKVMDHSRQIWTLLMLVVWHDEVLRGSRPAAEVAGLSA